MSRPYCSVMVYSHALITGAGSGFGRGLAIELAERGHGVIAGVLSDEEAATYDGVGGVTPLILDITDEAQRERAAEQPVDLLVNNAAVSHIGPLLLLPMERIREVFEVNVFATLALTKLVAARMVEADAGRILIMSSVAGVRAGGISGPYSMSKHALQAMGSSLRIELAPLGVDVALLTPGPHGTGFNDRMVDEIEEWIDPEEAAPYRELIDGLRGRITLDQYDPADAVETMADICEAETTELVNPIPPGYF
jgi:NAD(P)-dependent dehydrogenase (short-subunit alcohol dehydrogenase family)